MMAHVDKRSPESQRFVIALLQILEISVEPAMVGDEKIYPSVAVVADIFFRRKIKELKKNCNGF